MTWRFQTTWRYVSAHPTAKAEIQIRSVVACVDDVSTKED